MTTDANTNSPAPESLQELYRSPVSTLEAILRNGTPPPFEDLIGWEFNGANVGVLPGLLGIRKFRKGFYQGPPRVPHGPEPFIQGYNVPVQQNGIDQPWIALPSESSPRRFGFYRVYRASQNPRFQHYPHALLLDYGLGRNGATPPALLRDYLVQAHPGSSDLLVGKAYLALGPVTLPAGFFVLQRARRHDFTG